MKKKGRKMRPMDREERGEKRDNFREEKREMPPKKRRNAGYYTKKQR
jgi:hypothetical protein